MNARGRTVRDPGARAGLWLWVACLAFSQPAHADDWANEKSALTNEPSFAKSKDMCRSVQAALPPVGDQVSPGDAAQLTSCDAETLYYGGHLPPDYVAARRCAMAATKEGKVDTGEVFGGFTVLMEVYANGRGVARNLDLATHFACNLEGAPAEMRGRVEHLTRLKARSEAKPFDFCDDITSGLAEGYCSSRAAKQQDVDRQANLDAFQAQVDPNARSSFSVLRAAAYAYAKSHAMNEVDLTGSARGAFVNEAETKARNAFVALVRRTMTGGGGVATPAQSKAADRRLNKSWAAVKAREPRTQPDGTVVFEGVVKSERAWIKYRDAFLSFSRVQWPTRPTDGLARRLTLDRADLLDELASD